MRAVRAWIGDRLPPSLYFLLAGSSAASLNGHHDMIEPNSPLARLRKAFRSLEDLPEVIPSAGRPGDAAKVARTIDVSMDDSMRFNPNSIRVKAGETVRFFIRNTGSLDHEMVIGTLAELKEHSAMMKKMPTMQHAEPNMIRLAPGQRGGIVWQFDKPGIVDFACLVPGHMEAGMVGKVTVN